MSILGTKEWMPHNENCMKGCQNDCRYCYGKLRAIRYKQKTAENWHIEVPNKRSQKPIRYLEGGVMFPTTHDLHIESSGIWMPFLRGLLEKGNDVLIVTKPQFEAVKLICEECSEYRDQIEFRLTIGTYLDDVAAYWEPGAPSPSERLQALSYIFSHGFKVSISMEPLLIGEPFQFIEKGLMPQITGNIWIGLMNYYKFDPIIEFEMHQQWVQSKVNMQRVYERLKNNPKVRWKDSVQDLLGITQTGERK